MRAFACVQSALLDRMQRLREAHPRELGAVIATIRSQGGSQRSDLVSKRFHATKIQINNAVLWASRALNSG